ncbi:sirohydrochlorin chelatase [Paraliomyxa miuraensis]|uniref:sirohydrochlorin chelatase n=1 Tax=Paraliomyxa miuraensis TaxID=376150 RepID=UPI002254BA75|nr:CbiX/SirB N-terminal domain-containing protein [Paraliomyxa miuraensis]MCX4239548.1 CbiX/SirB N-terminal domain-containing protein [Paraliomyxa miuraensis]
MSEPTAVVLLAHGSPDPDWRRPIDALAQRLSERRPQSTVTVAYLGFLAPTLAEAIDALAHQGHRDVVVLCAFLSPGGRHIKEDVPRLVAEQAAAHPELQLHLRPGALGAEPEVVEALAAAAERALHEAGSSPPSRR